MLNKSFFFFVITLNMLALALVSKAQSKPEMTVQVESKNISTEEDLVISVSSSLPANSNEANTYKFPEIDFFTKIGVSRSKSSNYLNGQLIHSITYSQHYKASNPGIFTIPVLEIILNQQAIKLESFKVTVTRGLNLPEDPKETNSLNLSQEIQSSNKPFLLVSSNNYRPFVGQGFTVKFSLFIPENNSENLSFDRNDLQIPLMIQKIKPTNCWQENFELEEEKILSVVINKKKYTEYRFFQSTYYALDTSPIAIPSLQLRLLKKDIGLGETAKIPIIFKSSSLKISPKALPFKSMVHIPVGIFELKETISQAVAKVGQQLIYKVSLVGDGNVILWDKKNLDSDFFIDFLPLNTSITVFPFKDQMFGDNSQKIQIIPKQPGKFALKKYFSWIYFNTKTQKIDTLSSKVILKVVGKPTDLTLNTQDEASEIYRGLELSNSWDLPWNKWVNWRQIINFVIFLLFMVVVFVIWKSPK